MTKIYRQLERSPNDNTKRQFMLTSEKLSQSLELDKVVFLNSFATDSLSARDCHKLIRSLSSSDLLPSTMVFQSRSMSSLNEFVNAFNRSLLLVSTFSPPLNFRHVIQEGAFDEITISFCS